ncbi:glycosyltransferase [Aliarcobacter cryaerophilus]|uniref:glycosyltransferase n=1 Tax=Aliarcobacter cryaerophilus TaxID=28198 RepID=UPI003DA1C968
MKTKIFYLTRSYYPYQKGGGPLMRTGAVKYLKELGWDVIVVMPNYETKDFIIENDIWQIPFKGKHIQKLASLFERVGIYEDYLDKWVESAFEYLKDNVSNKDIVFATSGGELGMIKLGSLLKNKLNCKFVVNFRDPLAYSKVHNLKLNNKFHISREQQEKKYLNNSDLIITSSISNQKSLVNKYPKWISKIKNNYFGYIDKLNINDTNVIKSKKLRIAYVGNMGILQKPEILYNVFKQLNKKINIEIYFIGNISNYTPLQNIKDVNVKFIDFMPHDEFLKFMVKNIDIGFVSLANDYLGACVPSKIYEYINLGLPMIGSLPDGDGKDIINNKNYGIACKYNDIKGLVKAIEIFMDNNYLNKIKINILKDKDSWSMKNKSKEVDSLLRKLINENNN